MTEEGRKKKIKMKGAYSIYACTIYYTSSEPAKHGTSSFAGPSKPASTSSFAGPSKPAKHGISSFAGVSGVYK